MNTLFKCCCISKSGDYCSSVASASVKSSSIRLTSELNPGFGKAVFFTGTFSGAENWTVALHADGYSTKTHCYYKYVSSSSAFEWKYLKGFGGHGDAYAAPFEGLSWNDGANLTKADALSFADFWKEYVALGYVYSTFDFESKTLTVRSQSSTNGFDSYVDSSKTIVEILNGGDVVFAATHDFSVENTMDIDVSFIDNMDKTIYTVALYPVNIYGDKGCAVTENFSVGMVKVNGRYSLMGCDTDADEENVEHVITVPSYWISRYEVTDAEFKKVFGQLLTVTNVRLQKVLHLYTKLKVLILNHFHSRMFVI